MAEVQIVTDGEATPFGTFKGIDYKYRCKIKLISLPREGRH
jgi:hypothetical protein